VKTFTPLIWAVSNGQETVTEYLLSVGADVNKPDKVSLLGSRQQF
jgi:ankyrin repeat protein